MSIVILSYIMAFKVGTNHIPFQLVYKLNSLLCTKYMLPFKLRQTYDPKLVRILTSRLLEL
jgi:hypothetical protein